MLIVLYVQWVVMRSPGLALLTTKSEELRRFLYFFLWAPYAG